jgi:glycosyltransferase involved in cell wall biosynthesis
MPCLTADRRSVRSFDVSIIGIVGLPGRYGGFETLADQLTQRLGRYLRLQVFCTSKERVSAAKNEYCYAHLNYVNWDANGWQSILYDFISLWRAAPISRNLLVLGVSGCLLLPIIRLLWSSTRIITNIDGLEWKRRKWGALARFVLRISEWSAVRFSHEVIADNYVIQEYVRLSYGCDAKLIFYGGDHVLAEKNTSPPQTRFSFGEYYLGVCRIEPENNVREILQAFSRTPNRPLVFVGNWSLSKFSRELRAEFSRYSNIELKDPIYDSAILASLRYGSRAYVHGHSAGGTNPSLVEAMFIGMAVLAYDVSYNRYTTGDAAVYWSDIDELVYLLNTLDDTSLLRNAQSMASMAAEHYTWARITDHYSALFLIPERFEETNV